MAELAYAHDSGSCPCRWVRVQVPPTAYDEDRRFERESPFFSSRFLFGEYGPVTGRRKRKLTGKNILYKKMKKVLTIILESVIIILASGNTDAGNTPNEQLWRNWHTRMIQVHVHVGGCGFKSRQLHIEEDRRFERISDFSILFFLSISQNLAPAVSAGILHKAKDRMGRWSVCIFGIVKIVQKICEIIFRKVLTFHGHRGIIIFASGSYRKASQAHETQLWRNWHTR